MDYCYDVFLQVKFNIQCQILQKIPSNKPILATKISDNDKKLFLACS